MALHALQNNFTAGEFSPLLQQRSDLANYGASCRKLENFIPRIYGGAFFRPGMMKIEKTKTKAESSTSRMIPFNYSANTRFQIELGVGYGRFYSNRLRVESGGLPVEITHPYDAEALPELQVVQLNDVVFIAHARYPTARITRVADDNWTYEEVPWKWIPFADDNITATTATVSTTTGTGTLTFSASTFTGPAEDWIGTQYRIGHDREETSARRNLANNQTTDEISVLGYLDLFTDGTWDGTIFIEQQTATGGWEVVHTESANNDRNVVERIDFEEEKTVRGRYVGSATGGKITIQSSNPQAFGVVEITSIASATVANVTIKRDVFSTDATTNWAEGEWSIRRGYPRAISFHQQRLILAGTQAAPVTIWASASGNFDNFDRRLSIANFSFAAPIAATEGSEIQSVTSHLTLIVGTASELWSITPSEGEVLTPSSLKATRIAGIGSDYLQPVLASQSVLFPLRGGLNIGELFDSQFERAEVDTISVLAEHLLSKGVRQIAFQQQPDPILWVVTRDLKLVALTFDKRQQTIAWCQCPTAGDVESLCVTYGDRGFADEITLSVVRKIDGVEERFIERFDAEAWAKLDRLSVIGEEWKTLITQRDSYTESDFSTAQADILSRSEEDRANLVYSDNATIIELESPGTTVTGLEEYEGLTLSVLADGNVEVPLTVEGGEIELRYPASTIVLGIPYEGLLIPSNPVLLLDDGSSKGRVHLANRGTLLFWNTLGVEYTNDDNEGENRWFPAFSRSVETPAGTAEPLQTGEENITIAGRHDETVNIAFRQKQPLPANILGTVYKFDVHGN